jgi:MFS family permease
MGRTFISNPFGPAPVYEGAVTNGEQTKHIPLRNWSVLGMILLAAVSGSINKQMLPLISGPLKTDLGLSDAEIGIMTGLAPGLVSGGAALALGWLADRMERQWLLAFSILAWSASTAVMAMASSFYMIVFGVFALSAGEMALLPIFNSIVPDLFADRLRKRVNLLYGAVIVASAGITLAFCGLLLSLLTDHRLLLPPPLAGLAPWRSGLILVAALGIPVAIGVILTGTVPRQKPDQQEPHTTHSPRSPWRVTLSLYAAFCLFGIGSSAVLSWTTVYVMRAYRLSPAEMGAGMGSVFLASSLLGILATGVALRFLEKRHGAWAPLELYLRAILLSILPGSLLPFVHSLGLAYGLVTLQFSLIFAAAAHNFSLIQDLSPANGRGQASGYFVLSAGVLPAFAPVLVGLVSDRLNIGPGGLIVAMLSVSIPAYILGVVILKLTANAYRCLEASQLNAISRT